MAVMTSLPSDGVELEHKTQPVPSSEKMALDLDINGTTNHNEIAREDSFLNTELPAKSVASISEKTNGTVNAGAVAANSILADSHNVPNATVQSELVAQNEGASNLLAPINSDSDASSSLPTTNPTTISSQSQILAATSQQPLAIREELFNQAVELPPAPTTVPPTVEAQESDMRDEELPDTQTEAVEMLADAQQQDSRAPAGTPGAHESSDQAEPSSSLPTSFDDHLLHPVSVSKLDLNQNSQTDLTMDDTLEHSHSAPDISMVDAPQSPSKIAREREDDAEDGPSAKRTKTEVGDSMVNDSTEAQAPIVQNGSLEAAPGDDLPPTAYQQKELLKGMKNIKSTANGKNFARAVVELWPTIKDSYLEKVSHPMDLSMIENRLKEGYESVGAFKRDVTQIYENAVIYNGPEHSITKAGRNVRDYLLGKIPPPEPIKPEKKRKSTPAADPAPRVPPARRQSRGAGATAVSPTAAAAQTFALDPSGTPLIRRDSTKGEGGRPKREIHPPKSKDLIYSARPKKKKFAVELKFCEEALNELKKPKYHNLAAPFLVPVDPVALGIPDYFKIIKAPMDLSTVTTRLQSGQYESAKDFEADMRQIFKNCFKFNPIGSPVHEVGKQFEDVFEREWSRKAQWIADHTTSNAASPTSTADSDEEESEEDEPEEVVSSSSALQERLIEEQNKLIAIMGAKKQDPVLVRMQQDMIAIVQKQIDDYNATKKAKTKAKPKPAKRGGGATKKKPEPPKKPYKAKNIGIQEKEQISAGIVQLEGKLLDQAVAFLKQDYPNLNLDDETELDIDQFSNNTLSKLHDLIIKNVPGIIPAKPEPVRAPKPTKPKKNKPMSKNEQESKIEKLKHIKEQFERQGSTSDDAAANRVVPSAAVEQDQSSGDESPSDSEED